MTARLARLAAAGLLVATLAACGSDDSTETTATTASGAGAATTTSAGASPGTSTDKVEVKDFAFKPSSISVKAGTTVTWTFADPNEHTVASKTGETEIPESPKLKDGKSHTHTFATAGTYAYRCTLHNSMTATVVVTSA